MYCRGLGLCVVGSFEDHDRFDGVMLAVPGSSYHFEFTYCRSHPVVPKPTAEDLSAHYLPDPSEWQRACADMQVAGFKHVASFNPSLGFARQYVRTLHGSRIVLHNAEWSSVEAP